MTDEARVVADVVGHIKASMRLAPSQDHLLDLLVRHPASTHEIARALGMEGQHALAVVRTSVSRLRQTLDRYFSDTPAGRASKLRLQIESRGGSYALLIKGQRHSPLEEFWGVYDNGVSTKIVWAEPLFFFDARRRVYSRFLDINSDGLEREIKPSRKDQRTLGMVPCFEFQSSGHTAAAYGLVRYMADRGIKAEPSLTRETTPNAVFGSNVVVLGDPDTNRYVSELQGGLEFVVKQKGVAAASDRAAYVDTNSSVPSALAPQHAYAVLTRRPNMNRSAVATIVAAMNARAVQSVAESLVSERQMGVLFDQLFASYPTWPSFFQVLFRVSTQSANWVIQEAVPIGSRVHE